MKRTLGELLFPLDHKIVAKRYLVLSLFFFLLGGALALVMRLQLGWPGHRFGFLTWFLSDRVAPGGLITPNFYNAIFTMHATFMIFFAIMPLLMGAFAHYLIPLKIGANSLAFPKLGSLSLWLTFVAGLIMLISFFVDGGPAAAGWTAYPPLSDAVDYSGVTSGMNLWIIGLIVSGLSSILVGINYIATVTNMRAPGMTWFRMPLTVWAIFITSILLLLAIPVLISALTLLLFDRTLSTSFFLPRPVGAHQGGGQVLLWQHLFWFFGHPEVYIMVLPSMGIASDILSTFARKPIYGYRSMVYSLMAISGLGFLVWGHHMFQSGMNPALGTTFMISTMVIAVPSGVKVFNWLATLRGGNFKFDTPFLFVVGFVSLFVIGGLSGIFAASTPIDIYFHDSYFIVAHIHYVLFGGSLFAIFGGIYFWYPKMFGRMMNERLGKAHFILAYLSFNGVFFPMHILGIGGMMRRIYDYTQYPHLAHLQPLNAFMSVCAFVLGFSTLVFLFNFVWSKKHGRVAGNNPWRSATLEWTVSSPPPSGNFAETPHVFRGPYEYSVPEHSSDFWPQNEPPEEIPQHSSPHVR